MVCNKRHPNKNVIEIDSVSSLFSYSSSSFICEESYEAVQIPSQPDENSPGIQQIPMTLIENFNSAKL